MLNTAEIGGRLEFEGIEIAGFIVQYFGYRTNQDPLREISSVLAGYDAVSFLQWVRSWAGC